MSDVSNQTVTDPYAALRVPAFRFYATAWTLAVLGTQIQTAAVQWELYEKTKDTLVMGFIGLVQAIPVIALAIPAGQLADRFDRRKILIFTEVCALATSVALLLCSIHHASTHAYYVVLCMYAVSHAIGWPARSAIVPQIVPLKTLPNALTWTSMLFQFASITGPAIGGLLVWRLGATSAYVGSLSACVWFAVCLSLLRAPAQVKSAETVSLRSVLAGLHFVFSQKIILATISLDLFAVLLGGATYLLPAVATDVLHVGAFGYGLLRSAPALGAIAMGLIIAHRPPIRHAGRAMLLAVAGFGVATAIFGLSRNFTLSFVALLFTGAFDNISVVVRHTLVQVLTPDEMRGRVSAVNTIFIGASNELGGFESGLTARLFGVVASIVGGGIGTVLVVLGVDRTFPEVRKLGALTDVRPATVGEKPSSFMSANTAADEVEETNG